MLQSAYSFQPLRKRKLHVYKFSIMVYLLYCRKTSSMASDSLQVARTTISYRIIFGFPHMKETPSLYARTIKICGYEIIKGYISFVFAATISPCDNTDITYNNFAETIESIHNMFFYMLMCEI